MAIGPGLHIEDPTDPSLDLDFFNYTPEVRDMIAILMGGRAAEDLVLDPISMEPMRFMFT